MRPREVQALGSRGVRQRDDDEYLTASNRHHTGYGHAITLALIIAAAFAIRYWFNFFAPHVNNYGACDASEYLRNAQALTELKKLPAGFWLDCWHALNGQADNATLEQIRTTFAPLKDFGISGLTFPLFLALCYTIAGSPVDLLNWQIPLFAQSLVSALTCGLIAAAAGLCFGRPTGYLAGLIAIFYPAFIVNSGRLYSETFAVFLLSAVIYLTVSGFCQTQNLAAIFQTSFVNGLSACALQLTRSVMVVLSAALVPIAFIQHGFRKGLIAVAGLLLGFALFAAPWLAFTKLAFGTPTLVVDRVGHYNFFIGNNIDTQGWLSFPYPDGRGVDEKPMMELVKERIEKNPRRWFQLMFDKPLRLFKFPWNDFRTAIGPFEFSSQVLFHQVVIVLAFIGAALGFLSARKTNDPDFGYERSKSVTKDSAGAKLFLLFTFAINCAYLFFITVPRYNLTAMPVVMILAAAGVVALLKLFTVRGGALCSVSIVFAAVVMFCAGTLDITSAFATAFGPRAVFWGLFFKQTLLTLAALGLFAFMAAAVSAIAPKTPFQTKRAPGAGFAYTVIMVAAITALPLCIAPVSANGRWYEWACPINNQGEFITQDIAIPAAVRPNLMNRQLYLLIDTNGQSSASSLNVQVNGRPLSAPIIPSISLTEDFSRLVPARGSYMREGEWVFGSLTESAEMKNGDLRQWFLLPLPTNIVAPNTNALRIKITKSNSTPATIFGAYASEKEERKIPSVGLYSWEKAFYGVENPSGLSDTRYDERISGAGFVDSDNDLSPSRGLQTGSYNIRLLAGLPATKQASNRDVYTVELSRQNNMLTPLGSKFTSAALVPDSKGIETIVFANPASYAPDDLWFIRCSGKVRRTAGSATIDTTLSADYPGKVYRSPWAPKIACTDQWTTFDFAVPLQPSALGTLRDIRFEMQIQTGNSTAPTNAATEIKDVQLQILSVPNNPLSPGHLII